MIASCNVCKEEGTEPFSVPWDEIGAELMTAHLKDKHSMNAKGEKI